MWTSWYSSGPSSSDIAVVLIDIQCDHGFDLDDLLVGESCTLQLLMRPIAALSHEGPGESQGHVDLLIGRPAFTAGQNLIVCQPQLSSNRGMVRERMLAEISLRNSQRYLLPLLRVKSSARWAVEFRLNGVHDTINDE